MICEFSEARYKKDKREFEKQVKRALALLERNESGRRAKFVKKSREKDKPFIFDTDLQAKAEKLLGIKGYVTNIPENVLASAEIVAVLSGSLACGAGVSDEQVRPAGQADLPS